MSNFKYPLLRYVDKGKLSEWRVSEDFHRSGEVVKKGFITDLASTPRLVWSILPPFGKWLSATVVHDWIYRQRQSEYSRKEADETMYNIMLEDGVPIYIAKIMYQAVRLFGKKKWDEYSS